MNQRCIDCFNCQITKKCLNKPINALCTVYQMEGDPGVFPHSLKIKGITRIVLEAKDLYKFNKCKNFLGKDEVAPNE